MKKIILLTAAYLFTAVILTAADQTQTNPFDNYDKGIKNLEEKNAKETNGTIKRGLTYKIQRLNDRRENMLKKLTAPLEKESSALSAEIIKAKAKDMNADVSVKQARFDYLEKMIRYYNDLSAGLTAEMPKDPAKDPAAKPPATTDKPSEN